MIDSVHFGVQHVSIGGYKIVTPDRIFSKRFSSPHQTREQQKISAGEILPELSLVAIEGEGGSTRIYDPLAERSLFKIFSDLKTSNSEIICFANQYGFLGEGFSTEEILGDHVEPLSVWISHISKMKYAVKLWNHIQNENDIWLQERIKWIGDKEQPITEAKVNFKDSNKGATIAAKGHNETALEQFTFGETDKPARIYLQRLINKELNNRVTSKLLFKEDWTGQHNVITANNLIGFMWLQLALTVEGNLKYRKCVICNKPFRVDPSERGKPRRFCSSACKSKDYRIKKKATSNE